MSAMPSRNPTTSDASEAGPIPAGLRVFTCGHSFHAPFIPALVAEFAASAHIKEHTIVGVSMIGGSRAFQHFGGLPVTTALTEGKVDLLTLSCFEMPDNGIMSFAKLAVAHNPGARVTVQELWIPEDHWPFDFNFQITHDWNASTIDGLQKTHAPYCKAMEDFVTAVNTDLGKQVVCIVPDARATIALRGRIIAGAAPGLHEQSELFSDAWGHPNAPLKLLSAYCHFAVIYRRSPVGLPIPPTAVKEGWHDEALNRLLQELAWDAVIHHPLSGVKGAG